MATQWGLESLSIGALAERAGMSKSGLYAHFESKEDLQCQVLDAGAQKFIDEVMAPALAHPRGLPRIEQIHQGWMRWETEVFTGGCPFIAASIEYDDREGPVRATALAHVDRMVEAVKRAASIAIEEGHFRSDLDLDAYAFQTWSIIVGYHHYARFRRDPKAAEFARQALADLNSQSAA